MDRISDKMEEILTRKPKFYGVFIYLIYRFALLLASSDKDSEKVQIFGLDWFTFIAYQLLLVI